MFDNFPKFVILTVIALLVLLAPACTKYEKALKYMELRYPSCDILKIEETVVSPYLTVTYQCPLQPPKTLRIKKNQ